MAIAIGTRASEAIPMAAQLVLGVEQEFDLLDSRGPIDFNTLFPRAIARGRSTPFRNCDNAAVLEAGYVLCADGWEAEFATVPIGLSGDGSTRLAREVTRCREDMLAKLRRAGVRDVRGYSTHLSINVPAGLERQIAEDLATTVGPALVLLMEAKTSPGLLIRTRRGRLELGSEYIDDEQQLEAAIVFLAGAVHARLFNPQRWAEFPRLRLVRAEEANIRPGIYLPRDAYGGSLHKRGRAAMLTAEDGHDLFAGEHLQSCARLVEAELEQIVDPRCLARLRQFAFGRQQLQIEAVAEPGWIAPRRARRAARESQTLSMLARARSRGLAPRFVDWEGAAFEWPDADRDVVVGVPWAHLPALFVAARKNDIGEVIAAGQPAQPMLNSLDQLQSPQVFEAMDPEALGAQAVSDKGGDSGKGGKNGSPKGGSGKPPGWIPSYRRGPPPARSRPPIPWRRIGWLIPVIILIITGIVFLRRPPPVPDDSVPQRSITSTPPRPVQTYVRETPQACGLEILTKLGPDGAPMQGPLSVDWTRARGAFSYKLELSQPGEDGNPWIFTTDDESKTLFMENFPGGGQYVLSVTALDAYGNPLCSAQFEFEKPASGDGATRPREGEGQDCDPNGIFDPC